MTTTIPRGLIDARTDNGNIKDGWWGGPDRRDMLEWAKDQPEQVLA
jgi:hypothetical protein